MSAVSSYLRRNHLGLVAVFIALGGTAYAVDGPNPGQNTIGSEDIIGNEVKSDDIGNGRIFNLDIADEIIQSGKIKDGTLQGDDLGDPLTLASGTEDPTETYGTVSLSSDAFLDSTPQGRVTVSSVHENNGSIGITSSYIGATSSTFRGLRNSGDLHLQNSFGSADDDVGVIFDRAGDVPELSAEQSFLYMRRSGEQLQMVVLWPNGERDVIAVYDTEE